MKRKLTIAALAFAAIAEIIFSLSHRIPSKSRAFGPPTPPKIIFLGFKDDGKFRRALFYVTNISDETFTIEGESSDKTYPPYSTIYPLYSTAYCSNSVWIYDFTIECLTGLRHLAFPPKTGIAFEAYPPRQEAGTSFKVGLYLECGTPEQAIEREIAALREPMKSEEEATKYLIDFCTWSEEIQN